MRRLALHAAACALLAGCPAEQQPPPPLPPVSAGNLHVRVFTEPAPVRAIAAIGSDALVATDDGLEYWDASGHILADDTIIARLVAPIADADRAWIATDTAIGLYEPLARTFDALPPPAPGDADIAAATALAGDATTAFVGGPRGVVAGTADGWIPTSITDPVHALALDGAGWLWAATSAGVVVRKPDGESLTLDAAHGCVLAVARLVVLAPGERVLAVGTDDAGHERVAIGGRDLAWTTYRTLPGTRWDAAVRRGGAVILTSGERVDRIAPGDGDGSERPLARDGMRLVPVATTPSAVSSPSTTPPAPASEWTIDRLDLVVPPGALSIGAAADQLLVGTRELGTARYRDGDRHPRDWLRRRAMFADATSLTVACAAREDCWVATGARRAWHWTGESFAAAGPADDNVLAVVRDPGSNAVYAIHRTPAEPTTLHVSRLDAAAWTPRLDVTTAGDRAEIAFARFASPGRLWIGLRYREDGEPQSDGVAVVDVSAARVAYHGNDRVAAADRAHDVAIPAGAIDADIRGAAAWIATDDSVTRVSASASSSASTTYTARDGLHDDIRALAIAPTGQIIVATRAGVGIFDGKTWDFPAVLRFEANDVVATRSGLWMASERGVVAYDGRKVRRFDALRGLAENEILDVAADQFDRIWARGPGSLTLIAP